MKEQAKNKEIDKKQVKNKTTNNRATNKKIINNKEINKKKMLIVYIAAIILLIYLIYIIYLLIKQPTNVFTIEEGKLYKEETDVGYVIRNEKVVKGEK